MLKNGFRPDQIRAWPCQIRHFDSTGFLAVQRPEDAIAEPVSNVRHAVSECETIAQKADMADAVFRIQDDVRMIAVTYSGVIREFQRPNVWFNVNLEPTIRNVRHVERVRRVVKQSKTDLGQCQQTKAQPCRKARINDPEATLLSSPFSPQPYKYDRRQAKHHKPGAHRQQVAVREMQKELPHDLPAIAVI